MADLQTAVDTVGSSADSTEGDPVGFRIRRAALVCAAAVVGLVATTTSASAATTPPAPAPVITTMVGAPAPAPMAVAAAEASKSGTFYNSRGDRRVVVTVYSAVDSTGTKHWITRVVLRQDVKNFMCSGGWCFGNDWASSGVIETRAGGRTDQTTGTINPAGTTTWYPSNKIWPKSTGIGAYGYVCGGSTYGCAGGYVPSLT